MDNKVGYTIIALLLVVVVVFAGGFVYLQNEINSLKPQAPNPTPNINPTSTIPVNIATPTPTPLAPTPTQPLYQYVVFEWTLKPEYINNVQWLSISGSYNQSLSWRENYLKLISDYGAFPSNTRGSLASLHMWVDAFVSVDFNEQTGYTKAIYTYYNGYIYEVEVALPLPDSSTGWTQTFVK